MRPRNGVVGAGADVGQAGGGVGGLVEEAAVVDPGGGGAAGGAVGGELAPGGCLGGGVEVQVAGAVRVGDLEGVAGARAGADDVAAGGQGDDAGAGDDGGAAAGGGGVLLAVQVQGGRAGVFLQEQAAVGGVYLGGGAAGAAGDLGQLPGRVPRQGLGPARRGGTGGHVPGSRCGDVVPVSHPLPASRPEARNQLHGRPHQDHPCLPRQRDRLHALPATERR
jgi:hypothetical protein